jgi:hypothetical protein
MSWGQESGTSGKSFLALPGKTVEEVDQMG